MAADQLGKLRARLEADSSGFSAGIGRAKRELTGFVGSVRSGLGKVSSAFGGLGGAITAAGFGAAIKSSLDELDRIDELSSTFGIATADLQKLSLIAKQSGVDLEALGRSTAKLYKTIASNPDVFGSIGISAEKLSTLDLPGKLGMIGDALNRIESDEMRVAKAMEIFGKSGADLLPLLANGMEGIAKAAAEIEAMGGIFSDEDIKKAVEANDALDKAGKSLKTITTELAITFAPIIEAVANAVAKLNDAFQSAQGLSAQTGEAVGRDWAEGGITTGRGAAAAGAAAAEAISAKSAAAMGAAWLRRITAATEQTAAAMSTPTW